MAKKTFAFFILKKERVKFFFREDFIDIRPPVNFSTTVKN
jgi:hypothetical protein